MNDINYVKNVLQEISNCSQALLKTPDVNRSAQTVYTCCKHIIGAASGYFVLCSADESRVEILFRDMDATGEEPDFPRLISRMRNNVDNTWNVVLENNFQHSEWQHYFPAGYEQLENILLVPVALDNKYIVVLFFADKPGGFHEDDLLVAGVLAELTAAGLQHNKAVDFGNEVGEKAANPVNVRQNPKSTAKERQKVPSSQEMKQIVRNLGTYQIGLEMRNENLRSFLQDLEESRRRLADLYEFAPVGYFTLDPEGVIILVNLAAVSMLTWPRDQLLHKSLEDFVHDEDRHVFQQCIQNTLLESTKQSCESRFTRKDTTPVSLYLESIPIRDDAGAVSEIRMTATDLSQRKKMEIKLLESESLFRTIFETSPDAININRLQDGKFIIVNNTFLDLTGYKKSEVIGKTALQLNFWTDLDRRELFFSRLHRQGSIKNFSADFKRRDGIILNTQVSAVIISYQGKPHLLAVTQDITELRKAEKSLLETHRQLQSKFAERSAELKDSRNRYETVVEALLTGVYMHAGSRIVFANKEFANIFGYRKDEIPHMNLHNLIHPDDREFYLKLHENIQDKKDEENDFEIRGRTKKGGIVHLLGRSKSLVDHLGQRVILGNIANISKRKLAEAEMQETEEELRILSSQLMSAEERERKRIANDIHDSIGQALSAIKFSIENALGIIPVNSFPEATETLESIIPLIQQSIEEVRRIIMDLRPSILDDLGLIATISWFCREFETIYSEIQIEKKIEVGEADISPALKTVIYRIVQEALNNAAKHSGTNCILLHLMKNNDNLKLLIEDRGIGFDLKKEQSRIGGDRGIGLTSMKERAQLSGGDFNIEAIPGSGTIIRFSWPLAAAKEEDG